MADKDYRLQWNRIKGLKAEAMEPIEDVTAPAPVPLPDGEHFLHLHMDLRRLSQNHEPVPLDWAAVVRAAGAAPWCHLCRCPLSQSQTLAAVTAPAAAAVAAPMAGAAPVPWAGAAEEAIPVAIPARAEETAGRTESNLISSRHRRRLCTKDRARTR